MKEREGAQERCPYCRDDLGVADVLRCPACVVLIHANCRDALERCPTVGCEGFADLPAAPIAPVESPAGQPFTVGSTIVTPPHRGVPPPPTPLRREGGGARRRRGRRRARSTRDGGGSLAPPRPMPPEEPPRPLTLFDKLVAWLFFLLFAVPTLSFVGWLMWRLVVTCRAS